MLVMVMSSSGQQNLLISLSLFVIHQPSTKSCRYFKEYFPNEAERRPFTISSTQVPKRVYYNLPLSPSLHALSLLFFLPRVSFLSCTYFLLSFISLPYPPSFHLIPTHTHMHMHRFFLHQIDTHRIEFIEANQLHAKMIDIVEVMKGF